MSHVIKLKQETVYSVILDGVNYKVHQYWSQTQMESLTAEHDGEEVTDPKIIQQIEEAINAKRP